jgi:hypothetical protein
VLHAHERTIARPEKKVHVDKSVEKRMTRHGIESPETTGLRLGEPKSRHLKEFTLNAPNDFIEWTADFRRHQFLYSSARVVNLDCRYRRISNLCTRDHTSRTFAAIAKNRWTFCRSVPRVGNLAGR